MVILGEGRERGAEKLTAMGPERSQRLHNFKMPCLKWGNQRVLRCMKENPDGEVPAAAVDRRSLALEVEKGLIVRRRVSERERRGWIERNDRKESFKKSPSPAATGAGGSGRKSRAEGDRYDGIEAVREKLMFDLQTAADKMKVAILSEGLEEQPPASAVAATEADAVKPWNLRTRRAACKSPNGMNGATVGVGGGGGGGGGGAIVNGGGAKSLKYDERRPNSSPLSTENRSLGFRGDVSAAAIDTPSGEKRERAKFSVSLSRREIEEDFMVMTGHRPPRRPKKRPKNVQKELDSLFPGLWLTEITTDIYKVPDVPDTGKR